MYRFDESKTHFNFFFLVWNLFINIKLANLDIKQLEKRLSKQKRKIQFVLSFYFFLIYLMQQERVDVKKKTLKNAFLYIWRRGFFEKLHFVSLAVGIS